MANRNPNPKRNSKLHRIPKLLENLILIPSISGACKATKISTVTFFNWGVRSRNGDPALQDVEFLGVRGPFHIMVQNAATLSAQMIEAEARERAHVGSSVQVVFQGQPQFLLRDPKVIAGMKELGVFEEGDEWERDALGERVPVMQHIAAPASLVEKMLSAHFPKRYGQHATLDVLHGGVLRLEPAAPVAPVAQIEDMTFEDVDDKPERSGGYLAVAPPATDSADFEARAAAGEFDAEPVLFTQNDGQTVTRMAEPDPLLAKADQIARLQPKPDDRPDVRALKLVAIARLEAAPAAGARPAPGAAGVRLPPAAPAPAKPVALAQPATERWREKDNIGHGPTAEQLAKAGGYRTR
jgi:hypothetical protein